MKEIVFPNTNFTFDLHYDNEHKAEQYRLWVHRVYFVSSTLEMSYSELWDLPEQEFLLLEEIAYEIKRKKDEARREILSKGGSNNG